MSGLGLTFLRRGGQAHPTAGSDYIKFKDEAVFNILMANGVSSDGVGITRDDAARVTSISNWFYQSSITSFDELIYFTGLTELFGTGINKAAFARCSALTSIIVPENVETIGNSAFYQCTSLSAVSFAGDKVKAIKDYAFVNVPLGPEYIVAFPNLETLGGLVWSGTGIVRFDNLGKITSIAKSSSGSTFGTAATHIHIPDTFVEFQGYVFYKCVNLEVLIVDALNPPLLTSTDFASTNNNWIIYVPDSVVDIYKSASVWSNYASRIKGISEYNG